VDQGKGVDQQEGVEEQPSGAPHEARQTMLAEAIGGPRGLVDSGLPAIVFVIANAIGGLSPAIIAAIAVGLVLVVVRLYRKESLQQAIAGFFGLAIAALVAARTGHASGFFLPGIIYQGFLAVLAVVSLVVGRPYVGYVMAALDPKYAHWRESPALRRAMSIATLLWGFIFLLRAIVQGLLYRSDHVGWLATAKIAMGWPLFAVGLAVTYWLARRAHPEPVHESRPEEQSD
jgi:intracellular septation protein A